MDSNFHKEWKEVGDILRNYTYMFYKVWELGVPQLVESVGTAGIQFEKKTGRQLGFLFNPKWWNQLNPYQRAFIVAHECLHVILNHGIRSVSAKYPQLSNVAMDVVVNTMLIDNYGFDRSKLGDFAKEGCWLDTVFPPSVTVVYGQNYEYYYNVLEENTDFVDISMGSVDDHSGMNGQNFGDILGDLPQDVKDELEQAKEKDDKQSAGRGDGEGGWTTETITPVKKRMSWYELFKQFARTKREKPNENEQWARLHRRLSGMDSSLLIPSEFHNMERKIPDKIPVWLFLDVSGSCWWMRHDFLKAYKSIPEDLFDVRLFSFDTRAQEAEILSNGRIKLYG